MDWIVRNKTKLAISSSARDHVARKLYIHLTAIPVSSKLCVQQNNNGVRLWYPWPVAMTWPAVGPVLFHLRACAVLQFKHDYCCGQQYCGRLRSVCWHRTGTVRVLPGTSPRIPIPTRVRDCTAQGARRSAGETALRIHICTGQCRR